MDADTSACLLITTVFSVVCFLLGVGVTAAGYEGAAIERNIAYYHPQTGEFTWKECKADE